MKKYFFLIVGMVLLMPVFARTYYLNSKSGADANPGTMRQPWKTLLPLQSLHFQAGDQVLFACGSAFSGGFAVNESGTPLHPIFFGSYGKGATPVFTNKDYSFLNGNVIQVLGSYVTISGLHFSHTANCIYREDVTPETYWKNEQIKTRVDKKVLLTGAVYQVTAANHLNVEHCEFEDCPIGVYINGREDLIKGNFFHDCNRFLWEPLWGPIAVVIANSDNEIAFNTCRNYKKEGGAFGADGGFLELDSRYYGDSIRNLHIHHNHSVANEGFLEITNSGSHLNISYNVSDDFQQFVFFWAGDSSRIENNTVIRTRPANSGVNTVFSFKNKGYEIRNNIFILAHKLQVFSGGAYDAKNFDQAHDHNIYFELDNSTADPVGKPLGAGDSVTDPRVVNIAENDFHLRTDSPAIDAGVNLGYNMDFDRRRVPVGKAPDIGAFEFVKKGDKQYPAGAARTIARQ